MRPVGVVADRGGRSARADQTGDEAVDRTVDPRFWAGVRSLPERQAAAIALRYLEDLSVEEIATVVGCRPGTVKEHLHRGRRTLAERLEGLREDGEGARNRG